jgi:dipeptidyl aminopeptidase/acylaminoacyl peptidase
MTDLDSRLRTADLIDVPDLWPDIERRDPRPSKDVRPTRARRTAIAALALAIAAVAIGFAVRAFQPPVVPAPPGPELPLTADGDLYFAVGGGEVGISYEAVSPDGSDRRTILPVDPTHVGWPQFGDVAWSPDGTRIAFVSRLAGHTGIFTANSDGSDIIRLDSDPTASWPSWSPDGSRIAFSSARADPSLDSCAAGDFIAGGASCPSDIYVMNSDGSGVQRLTFEPNPEFGPVWSADGSEIAFTRQDGGTDLNTNIAVMNADGTELVEVASTSDGSDFRPSWSPDGSSLVYASIRNEEWAIYVTDLSTGLERALIAGATASVNDPVWSPDGTKIAYSSGYLDLMIMNADGSAPHLVTSDENGVGIDNISWRALPSDATPGPPLQVSAQITQTIDTGLRFPESVVIDGGGVWVVTRHATSDGGELLRLDPNTGDVVARISLPSTPGWEFGGTGITAGLGSLWVAAFGHEQHTSTVVYRIDPETDTLAETIDVADEGGAADVWVDDTGIWVLTFADRGDSMWLYRLDETTHDVLSRTAIPANWSNTVAGAGGWIWVLGNTDDSDGAPPGTLFRIDPASGAVVDQFDPAGGESFFLSVSGDRLWFFLTDGLHALDASTGRQVVEPLQLDVVGPIQTPGQFRSELVSDRTGGVWVIGATGQGPGAKGVWHVSADGIVDQFSNGNPGSLADGIAAAFDPSTASVWIVHYENTVSRLEINAVG